MKYFLVLGIEYKFFKRPGNITIHVGDNFIDTFQLDRDFLPADILPHIESKWYEKLDKSDLLTPDHPDITRWNKMPVLFKVYEIDDRAIEGKLKIKVENSNNDYTNGFMKNSSMIKFPIVALFKKELVRNRGEMMMKESLKSDMLGIFRSHEWLAGPTNEYVEGQASLNLEDFVSIVNNANPEASERKALGQKLFSENFQGHATELINIFSKPQADPNEVRKAYIRANVEWYKDQDMKQWGYEKKAREVTLSWSCISYSALSFYVSREEIHEESDVRGCKWWLGGNFTAEFIIKTKHRTKYLAQTKDTRFAPFKGPYSLLLASCKQLLNIYDED